MAMTYGMVILFVEILKFRIIRWLFFDRSDQTHWYSFVHYRSWFKTINQTIKDCFRPYFLLLIILFFGGWFLSQALSLPILFESLKASVGKLFLDVSMAFFGLKWALFVLERNEQNCIEERLRKHGGFFDLKV